MVATGRHQMDEDRSMPA
jgi:hypothetical protein